MKTDLLKSVIRKFVGIINLKNWQVESDQGFSDIKAINKTIKYLECEITSEKGKTLVCADNHILITSDGEQVFAKDSIGKTIKTEDGNEKIIGLNFGSKHSNMYDLQLSDETNHLYYTNGFLSHNTTTYTIFALWYTMFFPEKKIMLLANKLDTVIEIAGRIRMAYEYLPKFLKCAVVTWNKSEIEFSNKSAIKGFAAASDAARGFSANCVHSSTRIKIRLFGFITLTIPIKWLKFLSKRFGGNTL